MRRSASSPIRSAMKLLCMMLAFILALMLGTTIYFHPMLTGKNLSTPEILADLVSDSLSSLSFGSATPGTPGSGITNVLLIGQDRREHEDRARSDSMILCSYNQKTKTITMTSILRDLYVPIPGHGSNRINAAYAYGGMALLEQTLEENLDIHISGSVEVDFSQFSEIIDLLGGVTIELRQDEAALISQETGTSLSQGTQTLSGQQALAYSRIRKLDSDGDFSRTNRQRKVLSALFARFQNADLPTLLSLVDELLPMLDTDLGNGKILHLAMQILPGLSGAHIASQHLPGEGSYRSTSIDGMSVLVADMDLLRQSLHQSLTEK